VIVRHIRSSAGCHTPPGFAGPTSIQIITFANLEHEKREKVLTSSDTLPVPRG
jgi:hypothetical protein